MFYRFRVALSRFMYGRYGIDSFGKFLIISYLVFIVILNIILRLGINIFWMIALNVFSYVLFFYTIYRMLSKNIHKRYTENQIFLNRKRKITHFFSFQIKKFKERKTHIYKKCPNCKAIIRLPRKKGKHVCCCPKCKKDFKVKVL